MATIKGQNLRLLVDDKCVAKALTCTVHIAMQVQESSTKDDTGDWSTNEVVGMSWDASCEAEVTNNTEIVSATVATEYSDGGKCFRTESPIHLSAGDVLNVLVARGPGSQAPAAAFIVDEDMKKLKTVNVLSWTTYAAEADMDVYITSNKPRLQAPDIIEYFVESDNDAVTTNALHVGQLVDVSFAYTTGVMNRVVNEPLLHGSAFITDLSINAVNRQNSTASIQLTGHGELEFVNE